MTLITSPAAAAAGRLLPEVDAVMTLSVPWMKSFGDRLAPGELHDAVALVAAAGFDAAVIPTVYSQAAAPAAMLTYMAGVPLRLAYGHEKIYALLTDWVRDPEPQELIRHEVDRALALVATVGFTTEDQELLLRPNHAGREQRASLLERLKIADDRWFIVHPGASQAIRRFPLDHFADAVADVHQRTGFVPIVTGVESEADLIAEFLSSCPGAVSACGSLDFNGFAALVEVAPAVVTNNTAPSHMAAALQRPSVVLYARTNPQHTPWQAPATVLYFDFPPCQACTHDLCQERRGALRLPTKAELVDSMMYALGQGPAPQLSASAASYHLESAPIGSITQQTFPRSRPIS